MDEAASRTISASSSGIWDYGGARKWRDINYSLQTPLAKATRPSYWCGWRFQPLCATSCVPPSPTTGEAAFWIISIVRNFQNMPRQGLSLANSTLYWSAELRRYERLAASEGQPEFILGRVVRLGMNFEENISGARPCETE